jgi:hypothetical protein
MRSGWYTGTASFGSMIVHPGRVTAAPCFTTWLLVTDPDEESTVT